MRKLVNALVALMILLFVFVGVASIDVKAESPLGRVVDSYGCLSETEKNSLKENLDVLSSKYDIDVSVVIVETYTQRNVEAAADDFYDYNDYGIGKNKSGIMLYISMGDREWHLTTTGKAIKIFSDSKLNYIGNDISYDLKNGNYFDAFMQYADDCQYYIKDAVTFHWPKYLGISALIGLVVALIYLLTLRGQLKSVSRNNSAANYVKSGSFNLTRQREIYLYKTLDVTRIEKNSSTTHTGSSGTRHGGASGKF